MTGTAPSFQTLTTMGVGGDPQGFIEAADADELVTVARDVWASHDPWFVLGGGSNIVVADDGFDGTVIAPRNQGIDVISTGDSSVVLRVSAGVVWDDLVAFTVEQGWGGIEALSGIPGRVGAAPIQNIGAYGHELSDVLVDVNFLDFLATSAERVVALDCEFGYRSSVFKQGRDGIVIDITIGLTADGLSAPVEYAQLAKALDVTVGSRVPVADVRPVVLSLRASKGMVLDPSDPDTASCGSFFINPIVPVELARTLPPEAPRWPVGPTPASDAATIIPLEQAAAVALPAAPATGASDTATGAVKLSAAWLIEHSGVVRGFALPGSRAGISSKHTLAITNRGGATAEQIVELARYVQTRVASEFGIVLQPEPRLIGLAL